MGFIAIGLVRLWAFAFSKKFIPYTKHCTFHSYKVVIPPILGLFVLQSNLKNRFVRMIGSPFAIKLLAWWIAIWGPLALWGFGEIF